MEGHHQNAQIPNGHGAWAGDSDMIQSAGGYSLGGVLTVIQVGISLLDYITYYLLFLSCPLLAGLCRMQSSMATLCSAGVFHVRDYMVWFL